MSFSVPDDADGTMVKLSPGDGGVFRTNDGWQICIPKMKPGAETPLWVLAMTECMLRLNDPEDMEDLAEAFIRRSS